MRTPRLIHIYTYIYKYTCIYMYTCIYICTEIYIYMRIHIQNSPRKWRKCNFVSGNGTCGQRHVLAMNWVDRPRVPHPVDNTTRDCIETKVHTCAKIGPSWTKNRAWRRNSVSDHGSAQKTSRCDSRRGSPCAALVCLKTKLSGETPRTAAC